MGKSNWLPEWATAEEAAKWLESVTEQDWPIPRLLDAPVEMALEIGCREDQDAHTVQHLFCGRRESFITGITAIPDRAKLAFCRTKGYLSIFQRPDGLTVRATPPIPYDLGDVRFPRSGLRELAGAVNRGVDLDDERKLQVKVGDLLLTEVGRGMVSWIEMRGGVKAMQGAKIEVLRFQPFPPEKPSEIKSAEKSNAGKKWTDDLKAEVRAYRDAHGLKKTAEHYGVSQATISKHVPAKAQEGARSTVSPFGGLLKR